MKRFSALILALIMLITAVPVFAEPGTVADGTNGSVTENTNQGDGVVLRKSAIPHLGPDGMPDGTIDITLEAYTTGVVTSTTKVTPTDIVLVLDMSGSMDQGATYETVYSYTPVNGTTYTYRVWEGSWISGEWVNYTAYGFENENATYYVKVGEEYVSVTHSSRDDNGFDYYYYGNRNNRTYVYPILDSDPANATRENNYSVVQFYTRTAEQVQTSKSRIEMLKDACKAFIEETKKSNEGLTNAKDMHSISIVKFAMPSYGNGVGNDFDDDDYNHSQVVAGLTTVNESGAATLSNWVDRLSPAGATAVDYGINLAAQVLTGASSGAQDYGRKQVVVVFTDGEPNHYSGYDEEVAASAVDSAKALKDIGVTVFSVCVDDDADASAALTNSNTDLNKFMHYISSNFPGAYANNNHILQSGYSTTDEVTEAMARGFYQTPDSTHGLSSIFESIAHTIETPTIEVGEGATLVDTINPYFTLPDNTNTISVFTSAKNATSWENPIDVTDDVTINVQGDRTISISGFDFDENYVSEEPRNGFYGKKLIITFNITPDYDALDNAAEEIAENGGMIFTNQGNAALNNSDMQPVAETTSPALQAYKVTYLVDGVVYKTVYRFAGADVTLIDEPADTAAIDYGTWTSDDVTIVDDGFTMPAEDVVIELTSTRKSYKVTYRYTGNVPDGVPAAPGEATHVNGATVSVEDEPYVEGYVFSGWISVNVTPNADGEFTMPASDVEFIGYFTAGTVNYTVEHYLQQADGTYPANATYTHDHTGTTGETVTAHTDIVYPNFTLDLTHEDTVLEGVVLADGSLVLKLYYKRNQYNVSYEYIGTVPAGAPELPATALYYYNADVILAPVPELPGYTFEGWATDGADAIIVDGPNGKYFVMPARDVVVRGTFVANSGTIYSVEHYLEQEDGTYKLTDTTTHTGTTGTEANAVAGNYPSYSLYREHPDTVASGIILGDGSLVLKLFYNRTPYKVIYTVTGDIIPDGIVIPETKEYEWGTIVQLAEDLKAEGYIFSGWKTDDALIASGEFEMPAHDVYIVGQFYREPATYEVEHYIMDTNGQYSDTPYESYTRTGYVGDDVSADYLTYPGFTPDRNAQGTLLSGKIVSNANGDKLVLKLYYERIKYTVTYKYTGTVPEDAPQLPATVSYYYEELVNVAAKPTLEGYIFNGWTSTDASIGSGSFNMPNKDVTIVGYFEAKSGTEYRVEHWVEVGEDGTASHGYELRITTTHTGTTDTEATATPETFHGYALNLNHPDTVEKGNIEGDGSLVLKLYYDRIPFKVTYTIEGDIKPPEAIEPADAEYEWGNTVNVHPGYDIKGYKFIGWVTTSMNVTGDSFVMPSHDVHFTGRFVLDTASYTVNHYMQNTDGSWPTDATYTHTYTDIQIGSTVTARTDMVYPGFTIYLAHNDTVSSGEVAADGSLTLKIFYKRNMHTVTYEYTGSVPSGAPAVRAPEDYFSGADVLLAPVPTVPGYTFVGWATDGADAYIQEGPNGKYFVMPDRDVTVRGTFIANSGTIYTVEHYLEKDNGYEFEESAEHSGTTDTLVYALPGNYPGYTYNAEYSRPTASGYVKGDGTLVLKLYYDKTPYKVEYSITGDIPEGYTADQLTPADQTHDYSNNVSVVAPVAVPGYRFEGWFTDDVTVNNGQFTMPSWDVFFSGYYVKTVASYTVEHYLMDNNGNWPATASESYTISGNIGETVSADYLTFTGFTPVTTADTLLRGEITADGSLVLKLFYARNKYTVTYVYESAPANAPELPATAEYYYEDEVLIAGTPFVSGYTFYGWTSEQVDLFGDSFDMPAENVVLKGRFIAGPSYYVVEHYKQNIDGTYNATPDDSEVFSTGVKVGDYVVAQAKAYTGFTPDSNNNYTGTVTPEPNVLVIKLKYVRNKYDVSYVYYGNQPDGAPALPATQTYYYGETVRVADVPTLTDYAFDGWHTNNANVNGNYFEMPAHNVIFRGTFVLTKASYKVEHYLQNLDGTWSDTTPYSNIIGGTIGETVSADYDNFAGFTPDEDNANSITSGVVVEDGSLVLKLYYERNRYTVTYVYEPAVAGAPALPATQIYYYGETVTVAEQPVFEHYVFVGWNTTDANVTGGVFEMPANDVVLKGSFTQSEFVYTVKYYINNTLYASYEVYEGDVHKIMDQPDYPAPISFYGWFDPIIDNTGRTIKPVDGSFVMPQSNVSIHGRTGSLIPEIRYGTMTIEKELEAPSNFAKKSFTFSIYREVGTRRTLVDTITIKAGTKYTLKLDPGVYYVYEEDAHVEGYSLFTTTNLVDNRVVVTKAKISTVLFKNTYYENILETDDHFAYIIGYPDGLVRPEANVTRAEVATIFFRMLTDSARAQYWSQTNSFSDVSENDWFNNAISTLANAGVLSGYADGTFRPNAYITRAELVKIAVSFYGTNAGQGTHFSDASEHWAAEFVAAAEEFGFIDGYEDGTFRPDKYVTRAEAMKVINRTLGRKPHKNQLLPYMITWNDNMDTTKWYYADVQEATNSHIYTWDSFGYEVWEEILPVRDWAAFEKEWSTAYAG